MEKEETKYFASYCSEKKMASEIFKETSVNVSSLQEKAASDTAGKKKERTSVKKKDDLAIKNIEKKRDDDLLQISEKEKSELATAEADFAKVKKELDDSISRTNAKRDEEIENANFNKTNINANAENEFVAISGKNKDTTEKRAKSFADLEAKNKDINTTNENNTREKEKELLAQINGKISEYFSATKKMEDEAKKKNKEKNDEIKKLNDTLLSTKKEKEDTYNKTLKERQDTLAKEGISKEEASALKKEIGNLTRQYNLDIKQIDSELLSNGKNLASFCDQVTKELNINLEIKRKEIIGDATTLQGEIDAIKVNLIILTHQQRTGYNKELADLKLKELKENNDFEIEKLALDNAKEVDISNENKKIEISKKNADITCQKYNIDIDYQTRKSSHDKSIITSQNEFEKEKIVLAANIEKENILAKIDIDNFTLDRDLRKITLDCQKEVLSLKQAVYQINNELLFKTNTIVLNYKRERLEESIKPYIKAIEEKQKAFEEAYNNLILVEQKEYEDTLKMLAEANDNKVQYLTSNKALISETDEETNKAYDKLIELEKEGYENSIKDITCMNDVVISAYKNKINDDKQKTNEEIERLNSLNTYIFDAADKVGQTSSNKLENSTTNNATFNGSFDVYYQKETKACEDKYLKAVEERQNSLKNILQKLDNDFNDSCKKRQEKDHNSEVSLHEYDMECNSKKQKLEEEYIKFVEMKNDETNAFATKVNNDMDLLEEKCGADFALALKKTNTDNLLEDKNIAKQVNLLNKKINKIKAMINSNIKYNYKNATVVKNKKWWIIENKE